MLNYSIALPLAVALIRHKNKHPNSSSLNYEDLISNIIYPPSIKPTPRGKSISASIKESYEIDYNEIQVGKPISHNYDYSNLTQLLKHLKYLLKWNNSIRNNQLIRLLVRKIIRNLECYPENASKNSILNLINECTVSIILYEHNLNPYIIFKFKYLYYIYMRISNKARLLLLCHSNILSVILFKYFNNDRTNIKFPSKTVELIINSNITLTNNIKLNQVKSIQVLDYYLSFNIHMIMHLNNGKRTKLLISLLILDNVSERILPEDIS